MNTKAIAKAIKKIYSDWIQENKPSRFFICLRFKKELSEVMDIGYSWVDSAPEYQEVQKLILEEIRYVQVQEDADDSVESWADATYPDIHYTSEEYVKIVADKRDAIFQKLFDYYDIT